VFGITNSAGCKISEVITLYHGSIFEFDEIDVFKGKPFKDFGAGFYTSLNREHAETLALRNKEIECLRQKPLNKKTQVKPLLYSYHFDLDVLNQLTVKNFDGVSKEWMRFVVQNRTNAVPQHCYDVVTGPTANDNTRIAIRAFFAGLYGDIQSDAAVENLIRMIEPDKLPPQFFFGSEKAVRFLSFQERTVIYRTHLKFPF
jgi:hypothetical protein